MIIKFEPRDAWVGLYWNVATNLAHGQFLDVYVCLIPFLVFHHRFYRNGFMHK